MATYVRQSSFSDGDTITAALFNNEFNQLVNAFNVATGHTHDGSTAGDGGPISNLFSNALVFGTNTDNDVVITFNAASNDGVLSWMEDEDYFQFSDDLLIATSEKIQFRDTAIYINSSTDGQLDIVADTEVQIAATTIDMNGNADISGNLGVGGNLTVTGTTTFNGGTITMGDAATDNVVFGADVDSHIIPDDDDTYDLGSSTQEWRNLYIDGTANIDSLVADTADINGGTIDAANITVGSGKTLDVSAGTLTLADNQISGDKVEGGTINATTINTLTYGSITDGTITVTAFVDEDDMSSNSATLIPTQQSVKAYVDAQDTAQDLDLVSDSGTIAIDLDGETLTVTGGEGIDTSASSNTLTITGEDATTSNKGIASFNSDDFNVSSGAVTLATTSTAAELNLLDGTTAGTIVASKGVAVDANKDITGFRNITLTGELDAGSLDVSGNVDVDGTLETDALSINGTVVTSTAAELNILDGKAFLDEDDMSSNSATGIASQQSIKAYVDSQVTAQDLDFQGDTGGALSIDLDSESLTIAGGTGLDTVGSGNTVTVNIDSTVATLTGSQTLTNKSLTAPTLTGTATVASLDISGDIDVDGTTNLDVVDIDGAVDMASTLAVGGVVTVIDGSTSAPSITNAGDANTGIYFPADDNFGIVVGGSRKILANSSGVSINNGVLDADGGITVDNITIDGNEIDVSSGNMTLDSAGEIILDADGGNIIFYDAGVNIGRISNASSNLRIQSDIDDKDIIFRGKDGSSYITALTLDMSAAGAATFNSSVRSTSLGIGMNPTELVDITSSSGDARIRLDAPSGSDTEIKFFNATVAQYTIGHDDATDNFVIGTANVDSPLVTVNKSGVLTANAGVVVDNITIDGNEIDVSSGNFVLDVAGEIELDADGGKWIFLDGGTQIGRIENSSSDLIIKASVNDKDIKFNGEDGGSNITALTLDMSDGGTATFNAGATFGGDVYASTYRKNGDSDTYLNFPAANQLSLVGGGATLFKAYQIAGAYGVLEAHGSGSATYPNYTFNGDSNTGMYRATTDTLAFTTGGTERLRLGTSEAVVNEGSADYDFRVESNGHANMLRVDGGTDRVAVKLSTSEPSNTLDVNGDISFTRTVSKKVSTGAANTNFFTIYEKDFETSAFTTNQHWVRITAAGPTDGSFGSAEFYVTFKQQSGSKYFNIVPIENSGINIGYTYDASGGTDSAGKLKIFANSAIGNYTYLQVFATARDGNPDDIITSGTFPMTDTGSGTAPSGMTTLEFPLSYSGNYYNLSGGHVSNEFAINDASNDLNFRVESDSHAHALFVDGGTSRVGINKSSPDRALHVNSIGASDIATFQNDSGSYTFGKTANLGSLDLASDANFRIRHGSTESVRFGPSATIFNEGSADNDFRVESNGNANMLFVDGGNNSVNIGTSTNSGFTFNVAGSTQVQDNLVVVSTGGANLTQGDIMIKSSTSDSPSARGQGVFMFNEGADQTWYAGTGYNAGAHYHIGFAASASASKEGARVTNGVFHLYNDASGAVFNENSADRDFRVESNVNANTIFVEGSSGVVNFGRGSSSINTNGAYVLGGEFIASMPASTNTYLLRNTATTAYTFYVSSAGQIHAVQTSISSLSDERLKENIVDIDTGLAEVMALKPRKFDWREGEGSNEKNVTGFVAQEVETVLPNLIGNFEHDDLNDAKSVKMGDMVPTLVKAIQEQQTLIETLTARITELENA